VPRGGAASLANPLRFSLLACALVAAMVTAALAQSIAINVTSAEAAYDPQTGKPVVTFHMDLSSARAFAELTAKNIGRAASVVVDGHVMSQPIIRAAMVSGTAQISGDFSIEEVRSLARRLSDGSSKMTIAIAPGGDSGK
jgi:preprotein translocase subunit SecD